MGCRLVILVKLVKKVILEVPNAPVATRVKRVRATVVLVNNARRVNRVRPMMIRPILARPVTRGIIKQLSAKLPAYPVFRANIKT